MTGSDGDGQVRAVVWDFDGTLMDTRHRNLAVNRRIVEEITGRPSAAWQALASVESYEAAVARAHGWREFYAREFELTGPDVERAGALWERFQLDDATHAPPFEGIEGVLDGLAGLPHGIVSQNAREVIEAALETARLRDRFAAVIGHAEAGPEGQKPAPGGLLRCLRLLRASGAGRVFFVGDHHTDALAAARADEVLAAAGEPLRVLSIGAFYEGDPEAAWEVKPDFVARRPADVLEIVLRNGAR